MSKITLTLIGFLVAIVIACGALLYFFLDVRNPEPRQYSGVNTTYAVAAKEIPSFAAANTAFDQKNYAQAKLLYQEAVVEASDQTQKNLINYYLGLIEERQGNYVPAIQMYKAIIATTGGYGQAEAVQQLEEMYYRHPQARTAIVAETFKDAPYSAMKEGASTDVAYRKLAEYSVSFFPLALPEARIALWYATDAVKQYNPRTATSTALQNDVLIVNRAVDRADGNMARNDRVQSKEKTFHPLVNLLLGVSLTKLASIGATSTLAAQQRFAKVAELSQSDQQKKQVIAWSKQFDSFREYLLSHGWKKEDLN